MKKIPYTQSAFDTILKHSRVFHNNQEINPANMNYNIVGTNAGDATFNQSFIAELDMFIQNNLYDVDIKNKIKNYISAQMLKWGKFMKKDIMNLIRDLDMKYVSIFKGRGFLEEMFVPYLYENIMINE